MIAAPRRRGSTRREGFTLLEVLIALVVFSIGLLGVAGAMILALKTNHAAHLRTQAQFLAQDLADRMRSNASALWANAYDGTNFPDPALGSACPASTWCAPADRAKRDLGQWSLLMEQILPRPAASVQCERLTGLVLAAEQLKGRPPYDGLCTVSISWKAAISLGDANGDGQEHFSWVFQP